MNNANDLKKAFIDWNEQLFAYFFLRVNNKEDAGDLTQEVFMRAWKYRHTFDIDKSTLKNWLYAIARNVLNHHYSSDKTNQDELDDQIPSDEDLAQDFAEFELVNFVYEKMNNLSAKERKMLLLRYKEDYSVKDIAVLMSMEYSAAKVAIHRALKKLQVYCRDD